MATLEGVSNYHNFSQDPKARPFIATLDEFRDPSDSDERDPTVLITRVSPEKVQHLPPELACIELRLAADRSTYTLELQLHPDLSHPSILLARMAAVSSVDGKTVPKVNFGKVGKDPSLEGLVHEVTGFFDHQFRVDGSNERISYVMYEPINSLVFCSGRGRRRYFLD